MPKNLLVCCRYVYCFEIYFSSEQVLARNRGNIGWKKDSKNEEKSPFEKAKKVDVFRRGLNLVFVQDFAMQVPKY